MFIINSLLDLDFYKLTMGQVQWHNYRETPVRFAFTNRTQSVKLGEVLALDQLHRQLQHVCTLRFQDDELHYLSQIDCGDRSMFAPAYIDWLAQLKLPEYRLQVKDGQLDLSFPGLWPVVTFWETISLSIVNELFYLTILQGDREEALAIGRERLTEKIQRIQRECPDITLSDFGTRRRFSQAWQEEVVATLKRALPHNFLGTSCVDIARRLGVKPMGTSAHEMYMVLSGIFHGSDDEIRASHNRVLRDWWAAYGWELSVALTDTYGSDFFFRDMTAEQATKWKSLRQDSGDPIQFGERAIQFYKGYNIDPTQKLLVFSDGLILDEIIRIYRHFVGRIKTTYGWGTNLTNDVGQKALSLIVKPIESCGYATGKLTDNLAKAQGPLEIIERFKLIFGHSVTDRQECVY